MTEASGQRGQDNLTGRGSTAVGGSSTGTSSAGTPSPSVGPDLGRSTSSATTREEINRRNEEKRREQFGGFNLGADFFGWLVAIGMTILLTGILSAIAAGLGDSLEVSRNEAERKAGTFGLGVAIALLVVLMLAYYAGGYVAGRMSRYDGGRQGLGVWLIGLVVTLVVIAVGWIFGNEYNVFDRVNLPSMPIPTDTATWGGIITLAAILLGTLLAAFLGGKMGQRYHTKIDRVTA